LLLWWIIELYTINRRQACRLILVHKVSYLMPIGIQ
jgi:hypothetical protein